MYRTSVITDEISQNLSEACAMAREFSLAGIEIRSVNEKNPFQMSREDTEAVDRIAKDNGLAICAVSSPMFKCDFDDMATRRAHEEAFLRMLETMHRWGAGVIRCFDFFNLHDHGAHMQEIADLYQPIIDRAEDAGVQIAFESEPSVNSCNITRLIQFLRLLGRESVGAVYDPGNEAVDMQGLAPYPDGYEAIRPWLRHVHVKDMLRGPVEMPVPLGEGSVDFHGVFAALKRDGYAGWVSLETHYRVKRMSDESLVRPQGSAFTDGGAEASRLYLTRLAQDYRWMEEA